MTTRYVITQGSYYLVPVYCAPEGEPDYYWTNDPKDGAFISKAIAERVLKRFKKVVGECEIKEVDLPA